VYLRVLSTYIEKDVACMWIGIERAFREYLIAMDLST